MAEVGSIEMFDFRGDAILFYNVGKWGERGYGYPNPGPNTLTLNQEIAKFIRDGGRLVSKTMHRQDAYLSKAPSLNVIEEIVGFVNRARLVISGRSVSENEKRNDLANVQGPREPLIVFPCPVHRVTNPLMREFVVAAFSTLAELMQDGENVFSYGISDNLARRALSHVRQFQKNLATEYFVDLTTEQINDPTLDLSKIYEKYQPTAAGYLDSTLFDSPGQIQMSPPQPEDLAFLKNGIAVVNLPPEARGPYPYSDVAMTSGDAGTAAGSGDDPSFDI